MHNKVIIYNKWIPECNKLFVCEGCPSIQASLWWRCGTARKLLQIEQLQKEPEIVVQLGMILIFKKSCHCTAGVFSV